MLSALHGGCVVPTRGVPPPYTEGLTSLHGKTGFAAARRDTSPHRAARSVIAPYHAAARRGRLALPCEPVGADHRAAQRWGEASRRAA